MIRMTRLTDYGIVLLTWMAREEDGGVHNARDLSREVRLPLPTVNKILKTLTRQGLLESHRGVKGGYSLARSPRSISVLDVITATEGPVALTECSTEPRSGCEHEGTCPVEEPWQRINRVIRRALEKVTLAEMAGPAPPGAGVVQLRGQQQQPSRPSC